MVDMKKPDYYLQSNTASPRELKLFGSHGEQLPGVVRAEWAGGVDSIGTVTVTPINVALGPPPEPGLEPHRRSQPVTLPGVFGTVVRDFLSELTDLSNRYGVGISEDAVLFPLNKSNENRIYRAGDNRELRFRNFE